MTGKRRMLGQILVAAGNITEKTLQRALEKGKNEGKKLGLSLEEMGVATDEEIAEALAIQHNCKLAKRFAEYDYPPELLKIVSPDTALKHFIFPLKLQGNDLFLALTDPDNKKLLHILAQNHGVRVIPVIASRSEILKAINRHYFKKGDAGNRVKRTVLIVDDNATIRSELEQFLCKAGFAVVAAKDGMEAFKLAISEVPDVIVTDKEMPLLNGYTLLAALRSVPETSKIPVMLCTSSQNRVEESDAFSKGFFDYLAKPVSEVTLISRVKRALGLV